MGVGYPRRVNAAGISLALSYDDVLLAPRRSSIRSRSDVNVASRLTRRLRLASPVVSANMDTVTEAEMAIAMARAGGIGIVHRFLSVERQVAEVARVKRAEALVIADPHTISPDRTLGQAIDAMGRLGVTSLVVVGADGRLAGLLTHRDVALQTDATLLVRDLMTPRERLVVGATDTTSEEAAVLLRDGRVEKLPLVDAEGRLAGLITLRDLLQRAERPEATKDGRGRLAVGAAIGVRGDFVVRARALQEAGADVVVLDIAHGHAEHAIHAIGEVREAVGDGVEIIAGNVATAEGARDLAQAGADGVKVGVGPGSVCTTRVVAGVGVPQLTAVMECAEACAPHGVPVIADGGIRFGGDVAKAIAAGAESVMIGNLLAGHAREPRRGGVAQRRPRQGVPRHGLQRRGRRAARARGRRRHRVHAGRRRGGRGRGAAAGRDRHGAARADRRPEVRHELLRRPYDPRVPPQGPLRSDHARRSAREPSPRRQLLTPGRSRFVPTELASPELAITTVRTLAIDGVQAANSGHPGAPMGLAPVGWTLFSRHLHHAPSDPAWPNRDRFVLSAGHASMLLYALLHLTGYEVPMEQLKRFRQLGSQTPGHPERHDTPGVEITTGPLGQGFANAVGFALAERMMAARYNRPGHEIVDHRTWFICSDGDLMEGISHEAASIAGFLGLERLIGIWDDNHISLDGPTNLAFGEDIPTRFAGYGWRVLRVEDGNDLEAIDAAMTEASVPDGRPTLIACRTHIGYGSPNKQDTSKAPRLPARRGGGRAHQAVLRLARGRPVPRARRGRGVGGRDHRRRRRPARRLADRVRRLRASPPGGRRRVRARHRRPAARGLGVGRAGLRPGRFDRHPRLGEARPSTPSPRRSPSWCRAPPTCRRPRARRSRTGATWSGADFAGRNLHYGVREHAMGAITNALAAYGGLRPVCSTFFTFSDYMKNTIRLAALMRVPSVFVYTHDSVALGEDGPTHQPIEHLAGAARDPGAGDHPAGRRHRGRRRLARRAVAHRGSDRAHPEPPGPDDARGHATGRAGRVRPGTAGTTSS